MGLKHKEEEEEEGRGCQMLLLIFLPYGKGVWNTSLPILFLREGLSFIINGVGQIFRGGESETDRQFRYNFFRFFLFSFWDFSVPYQFRRLSYNVWVAPRPLPVNP